MTTGLTGYSINPDDGRLSFEGEVGDQDFNISTQQQSLGVVDGPGPGPHGIELDGAVSRFDWQHQATKTIAGHGRDGRRGLGPDWSRQYRGQKNHNACQQPRASIHVTR